MSTAPFPLTATISASSFQLAPIASGNSSGWAPSCTTPACASTATWSTGTVNSTITYSFMGHDLALDGSVQGDMNVKVTFDGNEVAWNPSNGTLFSVKNLRDTPMRTVSLQVISAAPDAVLHVSQARINGPTRADEDFPRSQWLVNSNNDGFSYTGFVQQFTNVSGSMSPVNYVSSSAGDTASLTFNGTAFAIYGPCGPSNGMMRVSYEAESKGPSPVTSTVNTTKPIQADDCMLYQSPLIRTLVMYNLTITNEDGRQLGLNRIEFIHVVDSSEGRVTAFKMGTIICIIIGVVVVFALGALAMFMRSSKRRQKVNRACAIFCS